MKKSAKNSYVNSNTFSELYYILGYELLERIDYGT